MKKGVLGITVFLLFLPVIVAQDFSVAVEPIKGRVNADEIASFYLTITNILDKPDDYSLEFSDVGLWESYYTDPLSDYLSGINNVAARGQYTTRVYLRPMKTTPVGYHTTKVLVRSKSTGKTDIAELTVYITAGPSKKEYLPNVHCSVRVPDKIDPRSETKFTVALTNRNTRNITSLDIEFASTLLKNVAPYITSLGPSEKKEVTFPLLFDPLHPPQKDALKTTVKVDQYTFTCNKQDFEIVDYTSDFAVKSNLVESFLKTEEERTFTNMGNARHTQRVLEPTSLFASLFTWSVPEPSETLRIDSVRYRAWEFTLAPSESAKVTLYTNYRPIFHLFLAVIIILIFYYMLRAPIAVRKQAKHIEMREGGLSELKILLSVRNRQGIPLDHIIVHDEIPHLTQVHPEFGVGTLKPDKIMKHAHGGSVLEWHIDELEPYEERLITYKIKSNLRIIGSFNLPPAVVRYSTKAGRKVRVNSNRLTIGG
ncbi:hypothetical protein HY639_03830 [Candidatus Woesearchaeota archaeon]|nr:hypothetical protein [Candidatus Woesearchaeota archaeon]